MTTTQKSAPALSGLFKGEYIDVATLSLSSRRRYGLSTPDTIVHVTSDAGLREVYAYAKRKGKITFDTETDGPEEGDALNPWKGEIILVQVGDRERQFIVWARYITDWTPLYDLLADPEIVKMGQNLKFDARFILVKHGMDKRIWNVVDAGIVEQVMGCGLFSEDDDSVGMTLKLTSMEHMARRWLGLMLPKDTELRTGWAKYTPDTIPLKKLLYAADDVCVPEQILAKQSPWVKRLGLASTVNLEHAFLPVLADMEVRGIRVNMEKWDQLASFAEEKVREAKRALDRLFDVTVTVEIDEEGNATFSRDKNYGSKDQLKDLIREYMKTHYGINVIACNRHFKEELVANGFNPQKAERLFVESKRPNPKKPGSFKKVGAPTMTDHCERLWEQYSRYLPKESFFLPNTESKTFKLYRIIDATQPHRIDPELPSKYGLPATLVDPVLALRKWAKAAGTYGRNWHALINPQSGRVHFNFIQAALTTGRLSSTPNAQNLPGGGEKLEGFNTKAPYRECFEAEEGNEFIGSDFDQVEPRIIAQLSDCFAYKRVFFSKHPERPEFKVYCNGVKEALDLYTEIGKMVGVIPDWMTVMDTKGDDDNPPLPEGKNGRKQAKIVVLGLGYGTGKAKFYITLVIDTDEAQVKEYSDNLFDSFWDAVPEVKKTLNHFSDLAYPGDDEYKGARLVRKKSPRRIWHPFTGGEVTWAESISGRKRFYRPTSFSWWTTGRNQPIQASGADMLKRAMVLFQRWCWENLPPQYGLVNSVHDELLAEVPKGEGRRVLTVMESFMEKVGNALCPNVPITAAGYVADHWKKD